MTIYEFCNKIKNNPLIIHINPLGLLRLGRSNDEIFNNFSLLLNEIEKENGNIAIPTYSYSYAKSEPYDILNSPSDLDPASEYLRQQQPLKRTADGNFSYLLFGKNFSNRHFKMEDYSSFGENSLVEEVFHKDGYLGSIGDALEYSTEIHFLERMLNINYRFDKNFQGTTIDQKGNKHELNIVYYCRDLTSNYAVSFVQLKKDLKEAGLVENITIDNYRLKIELVKFKDVYEFIKTKLKEDETYLWEKNNEQH